MGITRRRIADTIRKAQTAATCEHCARSIGVRKGSGDIVLSTDNRAIVIDGTTGAVAVRCRHCKRDTRVPLRKA